MAWGFNKFFRFSPFAVLLMLAFGARAQRIEQGPLAGAVSDHAATILFITDMATAGQVDVSRDSLFRYVLEFPFTVKAEEKFVVKVRIDELEPETRYYYRVILNTPINNPAAGFSPLCSFKTAPSPGAAGHYTFTFGSCLKDPFGDSVFIEMDKLRPDLFLQLGDWGYPSQNYFPGKADQPGQYFTSQLDNLLLAYRMRYLMPNTANFLRNTVVDYMFDDEDGICDDFSRHTYTLVKQQGTKVSMSEVPYPDSLRDKLLQAYRLYFPAYPPAVQQEAYHRFIYGNTEFFFLDTRSTRSPNTAVFYQHKKGKWRFKVPPGHQILDSAQLNWLLAGLKNSTADWKLIVSGTTFNAGYKKVLDICMKAQDRKLTENYTGAGVAAGLSTMWFAFPETQGALVNFCRENRIENVVILSGDAHTSAIDDGRNSGFPELMSANLAQKNTKLAAIIRNDLRMKLWNRGGQGIDNSNFNNAFGQVEVFGRDSLRLSVVDQYGTEICRYDLEPGYLPKKYQVKRHSRITFGNRTHAAFRLLRIGLHRLFSKD